MVGPPRLPVGQRVRHYRRKNGNRSQAAIAGLCGISERYLQQIEAGQKIPSAEVLARLAEELRVPLAALLSSKPIDSTTPPPSTMSPEVMHALMGCRPSRHATQTDPARLRERVEQAWRIWQSSKARFTQAAGVLPDLIAEVEHARRADSAASDPAAQREVLRVAADMYGLLRSYCRRAGRLDLSLMVADRAIHAAEDADDPVRVAAAQWNLGHVLLSHSDTSAIEQAKEVALLAIEQLRRTPATAEATALEGALELVAVVSDARRGRWWEARQRIGRRATPLARQVGEGTFSGPCSDPPTSTCTR